MHEGLFGVHQIWLDTLLSLGAVRRFLVLSQLDVLSFVESSWKTLSFLRNGCGVAWGEIGGGERKGGEQRGNCDSSVK